MSGAAWASSVVQGTVSHVRSGAVDRRFTHPYRSFLLDLDELPSLARRAWPWFGVDRRRPVSVRTGDHLANEQGDTLRDRIDSCLERHDIDPARGGRTLGLLTLRGLGTGFDPVTLWFRYAPDGGELAAVVIDVHNTYGESHAYVARVREDGWVHATFDKRFHVSPFLGLDGTYDISVLPPATAAAGRGTDRGEAIVLRVDYRSADGADRLLAVQQGRRRAMRGGSLAAMLLARPFQGVRSSVLIRWHALHLWRAGAPFRRKPDFVPREGSKTTPQGAPR